VTLLLLTIAYVAVAALLLNLGFRSHWHWWVKLSAVLLTTLFYFANWYGLKQLQGWPLENELPTEFRLVSEYIVHPDKHKGTDGAIYLWVIDQTADADRRPRAYRMPYHEQLHEEIIEAQSSGKPQLGKRVEQVTTRGDSQSEGQPGTGIEFEDIVKPKLPAKQ
jgi:hypothetical protein